MNGKLENILKEVVVAKSSHHPDICLNRLRTVINKILSRNSPCAGWDSNGHLPNTHPWFKTTEQSCFRKQSRL